MFGVSGDSVQSHSSWLTSSGLVPSFPLLSDQGSQLAQLWGVPGAPVTEEEEDMGEVETRAVVITDNKAVMLEIISSSMSSQELVQYTKDRVDMLVEKRRRAVDREYREQCERVEQSVEMEIKLGNDNESVIMLMTLIMIRRTDGLHQEPGQPVAEGAGEERDEVQEPGQEPVQTQSGQELRQTGPGQDNAVSIVDLQSIRVAWDLMFS